MDGNFAMAQASTYYTATENAGTALANIRFRQLSLLLVGTAFFIDLLTPYLIWKRLVPSEMRWLSDLCIIGVIALTILWMLLNDRIPSVVLVVIGVTVLGVTVAAFEGQSWAATAWGWWRLFKYPFVGLLLYLSSEWPPRYDRYLIRLCVGLLTFQVVFQIIQFLSGMIPSDDLAGSFGRHGVGPLHFFVLFVSCVAFGYWLATDNWRLLLYVIMMSAISSVLGEMKAYIVFVIVLAGLAMLLYMLRGGQISAVIIYPFFALLLIMAFAYLYNNFVAEARGTRLLQDYILADTREQYLGGVWYDPERGTYSLGRNAALGIGWQAIQRDTTSLIFGMGIGARGESTALGIVGTGLAQGNYGLNSGTSLLVYLQEIGLGGLLLFAAFVTAVVTRLLSNLRNGLSSDLATLHFAVLLYSLAWPLWLWYHQVWVFSTAMILYWGTLGYILSRARDELAEKAEV